MASLSSDMLKLFNELVRSRVKEDVVWANQNIIIAKSKFDEIEAPSVSQRNHLSFVVMMLLVRYAYSIEAEFVKFTVVVDMMEEFGNVSFKKDEAIALRYESGPRTREVSDIARRLFKEIEAKYEVADIHGEFLRIYTINAEKDITFNLEIGTNIFKSIVNEVNTTYRGHHAPIPRKYKNRPRTYQHLTLK